MTIEDVQVARDIINSGTQERDGHGEAWAYGGIEIEKKVTEDQIVFVSPKDEDSPEAIIDLLDRDEVEVTPFGLALVIADLTD